MREVYKKKSVGRFCPYCHKEMRRHVFGDRDYWVCLDCGREISISKKADESFKHPTF